MTELLIAIFACIHFACGVQCRMIVTGSPVICGVMAVIEPMVNTVAFYLHERVWQRVL
ncbi:MAG: DUF2061 domain-containing protein, partial [Haliea sp.]|nr:DUF2061 domain-containing protein [Haliea sp.]